MRVSSIVVSVAVSNDELEKVSSERTTSCRCKCEEGVESEGEEVLINTNLGRVFQRGREGGEVWRQ